MEIGMFDVNSSRSSSSLYPNNVMRNCVCDKCYIPSAPFNIQLSVHMHYDVSTENNLHNTNPVNENQSIYRSFGHPLAIYSYRKWNDAPILQIVITCIILCKIGFKGDTTGQ